MTVFLDRYNRPLRIVWRGITRVRLQDNRGNTMILSVLKTIANGDSLRSSGLYKIN